MGYMPGFSLLHCNPNILVAPLAPDRKTEIQPAAITPGATWLARRPTSPFSTPLRRPKWSCGPGARKILQMLWLLLLLLSTLWICISIANYFFKMAFHNGWILFLTILLSPVCAV